MDITTTMRGVRRAVGSGLILATMLGGALLATAGPAFATPRTAPPEKAVPSAPPAEPGVPDVGQPGEGSVPQLEPTIDPRGNPVPSTKDPGTALTSRSGWTEVISVADGARIRTSPVNGTVIGLIPNRTYFYISCKIRASDGYIWGYANHAGRLGWVRGDLWTPVLYTAPSAPAPRPIPWC